MLKDVSLIDEIVLRKNGVRVNDWGTKVNPSFSLDSVQRFHPWLYRTLNGSRTKRWEFESQSLKLSPSASSAKLYTRIPILSGLEETPGSLPDTFLSGAFTVHHYALDQLSCCSSFIN
jgi:hypothetical protein